VDSNESPNELKLDPVRPNPFNPAATISYVLPQRCEASLTVYDAAGRRVAVLVDGLEDGGPHSLTWNGRDERGNRLGSGVYFLMLETEEGTATRKMVMIR
jgi:hypothetical protein